jgi:hypothetical protein
MSDPVRWAEVLTLPLPEACLYHIIHFFLYPSSLFISLFGVLGQVTGPDIQNLWSWASDLELWVLCFILPVPRITSMYYHAQPRKCSVVLGIKPRASCRLGKHFTTELYPLLLT